VVDVLVIPDGAAQPVRAGRPTALEAARTPVLDGLAAEGAVVRVATTPAGRPAGSETGIPALLGAAPDAAVGRGRVDAAAHGIAVPDGCVPWRADLHYANGRRASVRQARDVCAHMRGWAFAIGGHRLVLVAATRPADRRMLGLRITVWDDGASLTGPLPLPTTVVAARGAASGCATLLGADVVVPAGATGDTDTDLRGKAQAAIAAVAAGAERVVVHVGAPDEAAHRRDAAGVVDAVERMDVELLAPLRDLVGAQGGRLAVCPDHGTDPVTGAHDGAPVPAVLWGAGVDPCGVGRMHERAAAGAEVAEPAALLGAIAEAV
jgi:2,3-bisphosphoglycerate-independent phosphoglycerate mutase